MSKILVVQNPESLKKIVLALQVKNKIKKFIVQNVLNKQKIKILFPIFNKNKMYLVNTIIIIGAVIAAALIIKNKLEVISSLIY